MPDNKAVPSVALNDQDISHDSVPTEESTTDNAELLEEIKDINKVNPEDNIVPAAVIIDKEEPNKLSLCPSDNSVEEEDTPEVIIDEPKPTKNPIPLPYHAEPTTVTTTTTATGALDITSPIEKTHTSQQQQHESESDSDDELKRITEANRFIPVDPKTKESKPKRERAKSLRSQSVSTRKQLLVFSDNPETTKTSDRIVVRNHYGAGAEGKLSEDLKPKRRSRDYLVACDFSDESFHAIEWTMGTMMRDGDKLHIVTAVNGEDNADGKETGLSLSKELKKASETVTEEAKKTLGQMLLFDIELVTYAICGKVKDVISGLIEELSLTMVVCGSRGRGTMKGMLMGSISTYLVHKSPVPVTVIRPQKKKRPAHKRPIHAAPLSESVQSGHLAVDELSKSSTKSDDKPSASSSTTK